MKTPSTLEVLVPQGRDVHVDYSDGLPSPGEHAHEPINFHAMAAATGGGFHRSTETIRADRRHVLVLITRRARGLDQAVATLRDQDHRVYLTWKECGRHQLENWFADPGNESLARSLDDRIDGWIAASPAALEHLRSWRPRSRVIELPTPYPIDEPAWRRYDLPASARAGIFIGTREFGVPSRRHAETLAIAKKLAASRPGLAITIVNGDGWRGSWKIWRATGGLNVLAFPPMSYKAYSEMLSRHRLVLQRDESGVPGQVAGDALLAGVPCLGGNGMVDQLAFGHLPSARDTFETVAAEVARLLDDEAHADEVMRVARERAMDTLSFSAFRRRWNDVIEDAGYPS
jgi:hypothetical protein